MRANAGVFQINLLVSISSYLVVTVFHVDLEDWHQLFTLVALLFFHINQAVALQSAVDQLDLRRIAVLTLIDQTDSRGYLLYRLFIGGFESLEEVFHFWILVALLRRVSKSL